MTAVSICRKSVSRIRTLRDVNENADRRARLQRTGQRLCDVLRELRVGDSVFLEGYTSNQNDTDTRLKYMRTQSYTQRNTRVLTVRSTEEQGRKGVRVYCEG